MWREKPVKGKAVLGTESGECFSVGFGGEQPGTAERAVLDYLPHAAVPEENGGQAEKGPVGAALETSPGFLWGNRVDAFGRR